MSLLEKRLLTEELKREILDVFKDVDFSIIDHVLFFDGWSSYEENGGALIFVGIDDSIQIVEYGYSVMSVDNTNHFDPRDISLEDAEVLAAELLAEQEDLIC